MEIRHNPIAQLTDRRSGKRTISGCLRTLACALLAAAIPGSHVVGQVYQLGLRDARGGLLNEVRVFFPNGNGVAFTASSRTGNVIVVDIPLIAAAQRWTTDVDISAVTAAGNHPLYLRLRARQPLAEDQVSVYLADPALNVNQVAQAELLLLQSDEESLLEAYFKARSGCQHWQVANPRHTAGIRACKVWFDSAYRLAANPGRPYRMDRGAREIMERYETLSASDPALRDQYRRSVRPGYIAGLLQQIDALAFGDASLVSRYIDEGNLELANSVNEHLLARWDDLGDEARNVIVDVQAVDRELLMSNRTYIATLMRERNR